MSPENMYYCKTPPAVFDETNQNYRDKIKKGNEFKAILCGKNIKIKLDVTSFSNYIFLK